MKKNIFIIILILILFPFFNCDKLSEQFGFDQPEIVSVHPADETADVPVNTSVTVTFSKDMDKTKANNEFTLSSSRGQVDGFYTWSDCRTLVFTPKISLVDSNVYTISISSDAEDTDGNDLKESYESVFYVNADRIFPEISGYSLDYIGGIETPDRTGVSPETNIRIFFTEPIDVNTLYSGFSISPSVKGVFEWNAEQTIIEFNPLLDLDYGTNYFVTLSVNITDISGNPLTEQFIFNFTAGNDFENPAVVAVRQDPQGTTPDPLVYELNDPWDEDAVNYCIEKQNDIVISFSEPVGNEVYNAISISPNVGFYVSSITGNNVRLSFIEPMASEERYTLEIPASITDLQDNPLDKEYKFHFFTNSINSVSPHVEYITDPVHYSEAGIAFPAGWAYPTPEPARWTFNITEPLMLQIPPENYDDIFIIFSSAMVRESIDVSIDKIAGTGSSNYMIVNPDWYDENLNPAGLPRIYKIDLRNITGGNLYKITIQGGKNGVKDIYGNYMKEDFVQYIRFP